MEQVLVYVVIINDRYDEVDAEVFSTKEAAISRAKEVVEGLIEDVIHNGESADAVTRAEENVAMYKGENGGDPGGNVFLLSIWTGGCIPSA